VTARVEIIEYLGSAAYECRGWVEEGNFAKAGEWLIGAIPDDALVRLAIERGTLKPMTLFRPDGRTAETVYRLAGADEVFDRQVES
jgi:hypothetical protein